MLKKLMKWLLYFTLTFGFLTVLDEAVSYFQNTWKECMESAKTAQDDIWECVLFLDYFIEKWVKNISAESYFEMKKYIKENEFMVGQD